MEAKQQQPPQQQQHIEIPPPPPPLSSTASTLLETPLQMPQESERRHTRTEDAVEIVMPSPNDEASTELPPPATAVHKVTHVNKKPIPDITILGIKLPSFKNNPSMRIKFLIAVIISVYLLFYILQESLFKKKKCKSGGFVTLLQFIVFFCFGMIERRKLSPNERSRKGPLLYHIMVGFFCVSGFALSTYSLQILNFPTWLLFKSSRVVFTMFGGVLINKKRYGPFEYTGVLFIFFGLVVFTWGDWAVSPSFNAPGIFLIVLALSMNAAQDNYQEKGLHEHGVSENELVVYSYGIGSLMLLPYLLISGEFFEGLSFCLENPTAFVQIIVSSILAYIGIVFVLALSNQTSALVAVITTSCRKALSIITSFVLFDKPFSINYIYGTFLVFTGVFFNFYGKRVRSKKK